LSYGPALAGSLLFAFLPYHFGRGEAHLFLSAYYLVPLMVLVVLWLYRGEGPLFRWPSQEQPRAEWFNGRTGFRVVVRLLVASAAQRGAVWFSGVMVFGVVVCRLVAPAGIYSAFFGCFFLTAAGLVAALNRRSLRPLAASTLLVGVMVVGGLANLAPTLAYQV